MRFNEFEFEIPNISEISMKLVLVFLDKNYHLLIPKQNKQKNQSLHSYLGTKLYRFFDLKMQILMNLWNDAAFLGFYELFELLQIVIISKLNYNSIISQIVNGQALHFENESLVNLV